MHALVSAWLAEGRGHLQMCAHWRDGECLPLKARVCVLAQRVTQACAHTRWHSSITPLSDRRYRCGRCSAASEGLSAGPTVRVCPSA